MQKLRKKVFGFFSLLFFVAALILNNNSFAADFDYGPGRIRTCSPTDGKPSGLDFNPTVGPNAGGHDALFVLTNPVCITVIATSYAAVKISIPVMNAACGIASNIRVTPSIVSDAIDIMKATANTRDADCAVAYGVALASFGTAMAELGTIYGIANYAYNNTQICGANWTKPSPTLYSIDVPDYKATVQQTIDGFITNSETDKLVLSYASDVYKPFREWYYQGVETIDNPESGETCRDPNRTDASSVATAKYEDYPAQLYYLRGPALGNYNCDSYLIKGTSDPVTGRNWEGDRQAHYTKAYNCCKARSSQYICIDRGSRGKKFCKAGSLCTIDSVTFSTKFIDNDRFICAESYSLCPYNFSISGGTEYCDYYQDGIWSSSNKRWTYITQEDLEAGNCASKSEIRNTDCSYNDKAGKCRNYCQYLTHCTRTNSSFNYNSNIGSPYASAACRNFVGDSQNKASFGGIVLGAQRHFSAPIAQCVKETLENLFYNRAGHSECLNVNEYPDANGICQSNEYITKGDFIFKKGNKVLDRSFFETLQSVMKDAIKLVLTLSIMFYGIKTLLGFGQLSTKELTPYILKIGVIFYFALGDAWQTQFFDGFYSGSYEFARLVFKIDAGTDESKRDGCQFGEITLSDGTTTSTGRTYPDGKEYLAIWDTLDCKIMRYLGFGPQDSAANIASLVLASFFTGPIGIYLALAMMFIGICLISLTIRALHIFLLSAISIIIFIFVSPLTITCLLFKKTEHIFKKWLTELISFCLQPMILFAYIAILITTFDKTVIGSATFIGNGPYKTLACNKSCVDSNGNRVINESDPNVLPACDHPGDKIINPMRDSAVCILGFNDFGRIPVLAAFGINIPTLKNLPDIFSRAGVLTLTKAFLIMYLLYKFMDEISGITSALIGGTELPASGKSATQMFFKAAGFLSAAQKRLGKGSLKAAKGIKNSASKTANRIKSEIRSAGSNRGSKKDSDDSN